MGDMTPDSVHAINMLRSDHEHIRELLARLDLLSRHGELCDKNEQSKLLTELFLWIRIHSACEQKIFYPSLAKILDDKRIAEFGKDLYCLLSLMLELESSCADSAPSSATISALVDRFNQHVKKDESVFGQMDKWASDVRTQLSNIADKMEDCRGDLQQRFIRSQRNADDQTLARPMFVRRPRCA